MYFMHLLACDGAFRFCRKQQEEMVHTHVDRLCSSVVVIAIVTRSMPLPSQMSLRSMISVVLRN